ncbi:uncharacterized protein LOC121861565 [Homarus americanus]|uniref:uncharacterized protein LOC121861565 n=1 Tax=Homarus americanus TaxID=6706 RepID=UPI001C48DD11|nr:uncharacterized protein LOC121861565 [Homarus americanus]
MLGANASKSQHDKMAVRRMFYFTLVVLIILLVFVVHKPVNGISCYVCSSKNGSDINCEDPFHPALSTYAENCQVPKERHIGQFPANFCVKIIGTSAARGESLMIRTCVLENMDSQCGVFKFGGEQLTGCILTCKHDGCNPAPHSSLPFLPIFPLVASFVLVLR